VWGGLWYSFGYFQRANRPKEVELRYSDGASDSFTLDDEMAVQEFVLPEARTTSTIRIKVKGIYSGNTWLDTAISEVQVFDAAPEDFAVARSVRASSVAAADADGSYEPGNVSDGIKDTMWCEGDRDGDGTGEWLEFQFAGATRVGSLSLLNGIGSSLPFWMKGNRVSAATLTFSDGSTEAITVRNTMLSQDISFSPRTTSSVRLTITGVVKGKEFNDLCISEARFSE